MHDCLIPQVPPEFTIPENQPPFVSFGVVQTEDQDIPPNTEVFFFLIGKHYALIVAVQLCT